jgi:ABC-type Na+ efflux pump permease subunit
MPKVFVIARREYLAMVGSKAFLVSIAIMPVFMLGGAIVPNLMRDHVDTKDKRIAVIDRSGELYGSLEEAVALRNEHGISDAETGEKIAPAYQLERVSSDGDADQIRLELSDRVRNGQLYGFLEIPEKILQTPTDGQPTVMTFYAENTTLSNEKRWFDRTVTGIVQARRLQSAGIDPQVVERSRAVTMEGRGLFRRTADGEIEKAKNRQEVITILLPLGLMMFMFMIIMMSAQPMLESVLEEKSNRIAEVLLGSATPFQIMAGKLFGNVAGSLTVAAIYVTGAYGLARYNDALDLVPFDVLPWFAVFMLLAVLMFSSIFMAIGASVNQLKEAQSLLLPVWILIVAPLFVWLNIVREPTGSFATWFSLIPPFVPMLMCLRLSATSAVPLWQPILGLILMLGMTFVCVFAAGRVFRIGMLAQGRAPKISELLRWAISG